LTLSSLDQKHAVVWADADAAIDLVFRRFIGIKGGRKVTHRHF
jgi:hypothetical protein